jgi:hypothetical protein
MRSSRDGGATWSSHDVYPETAGANAPAAEDVTTDLAGNVYVLGDMSIGGVQHSIVRTNDGGSWRTSDDFTGEPESYGADATAMTRDASGTIYVGGQLLKKTADQSWFLRSMSPTVTTTTASLPFSSIAIESESEDEALSLLS